MASTLKVDKLEGSTGSTIEVTSGQTLKATAPIVATSILDTNSNELVKLTATGSATNELTVANAATGAGPTLSSTGSSDTNIDINVVPAGTGNVNLSADAVQVGDNNADATITTQGTGDLILNTNNGTNAGNITLADGAAGTISLTPDGTGIVDIQGSMNPSLSSTGKAMILGF